MPGWWLSVILIAQGAGEKAAKEGAAPQNLTMEFLILVSFLVFFFYLIVLRPEQSRANKHRDLVNSLKKNDEVVTVGGIYGSVVYVKQDKDEVVLRVDDERDVKIRVSKASIADKIRVKEEKKAT